MPPVAPPARLSRRSVLALFPSALVLSACGSGSDGDGATGASPQASAYRVTVTTPDDGEVTFDRFPRRIAALNGGRVIPFLLPFLSPDHELVGYGGDADPEGFPWIADQLEGLPQADIADGVPVETLVGWRPDLLVANGNVGDVWEPARAVGPLVQLPETDWRATTRLLGQIFQAPDVAERTVAETEGLLAEQRLATPVTAAVLSRYQDNGTLGFQVPGAELPNFLSDLGIEVAASETAVDGYEDVSLETVADRLDVDQVIVLNYGEELQQILLSDPLFRRVPAVAAGRVVTFTALQTAAAFPVTPPSMPVVLEALAPVLRA